MNGASNVLKDLNPENSIPDTPIFRALVTNTKNDSWCQRVKNWFTRKVEYEIMVDYYYTMPWNGVVVFIPKGFIFDGASIPKFLWPIIAPVDVMIIPGAIHDFGYRYQTLLTKEGALYLTDLDRKVYDELFRDISLATNGLKLPSYMAYSAIRSFGWIPWGQNRKIHRRVKNDFPEVFVDASVRVIDKERG